MSQVHDAAVSLGAAVPTNSDEGIHFGTKYTLTDPHHWAYGVVTVEEKKDGWYFGSFSPAPDFERIRSLFEEHIEMVNEQVFSGADEIEAKIAALGLTLTVPPAVSHKICDTQIGLGRINFHLAAV